MNQETVKLIQRRIWAYMIDHVMWMLIAIFVYWMLWDVYWMREVENPYQTAFLVSFGIYLLGMWLRDWKEGRSFGKRRLGLVVRGADDPLHRPAQWQLLLRNAVLLMLPLEFLMMWMRQGKRIGDEWSNTAVLFYQPDGAPVSAYEIKNPDSVGSREPGLLDDFRLGRFVKKVSYFSGLAGGAVGLILFAVTMIRAVGSGEDLMSLLVQAGLVYLLILPLGLYAFGAGAALLYYLPMKLFLRVMGNRGRGVR